jgi:hypothetical protein
LAQISGRPVGSRPQIDSLPYRLRNELRFWIFFHFNAIRHGAQLFGGAVVGAFGGGGVALDFREGVTGL